MTSFVSYAQNFEDVILWRALKHISNGFYIDVGAQDPVVDSVSRSFYEGGWRGIHAEATTYYAEKVRLDRPDERVFQVAVGQGHGRLRFFEIPETGLSTSDAEIATTHRAEGRVVREIDVPLMPLSALFVEAGDRDIHWLKVDVEGMEGSVLSSWESSAARPWIVVVESTIPNTQQESFADWEPLLLEKGYRFVYFDGLSRFYVSSEHPELVRFFGPGANVFDEFTLSRTTPYALPLRLLIDELDYKKNVDAAESAERVANIAWQLEGKEAQIQALEATASELHGLQIALEAERHRLHGELYRMHSEVDRLHAELHRMHGEVDRLHGELLRIFQSLSWMLTAPLRSIRPRLHWLSVGISSWVRFKPGSRPHRLFWRAAGALVRRVVRRPALYRQAKRLIRLFPGLELHLRRAASGAHLVAPPQTVTATAMEAGRETEYSAEIFGRLTLAQSYKQNSRKQA